MPALYRQSREIIGKTGASSLNSQRWRMAGHLHTLRSRMFWPQAQVAESVEDGFTQCCCRLIISRSDHVPSSQRSVHDAMNEPVVSSEEISAVLVVELSNIRPHVADSSPAMNKQLFSLSILTSPRWVTINNLHGFCAIRTVTFNIG